MSSPPTITVNTSLATLGASNLTQVFSALSNPSSFRFTGGGASWVNTTERQFPASSRISGGNMAGLATADGGIWQVGAIVDAARVAIRVTGNVSELYRFKVDGQYVSFTGTAVGAGGTATYALLDFGSKAPRLIEIENGQSTDGRAASRRFISMSIDPSDTLTAPPAAALPTIVLGDSFTAPTGSTIAGDSWSVVMADYLGLKDRWASGQGGTGYVNDAGTGTKYKLADRLVADLDRMIAITPPKIVMVAMGLNDLGAPGSIEAQANACFDIIRQKCPDALVFVLAPWDTAAPSAVSGAYTTGKAGIISAMGSRGGFYFVDMEGVAFTKIGDATHPNDAGHTTLGLSVNSKVRALVA
jgi:hypothetical protein